jgi:hypothetical protein
LAGLSYQQKKILRNKNGWLGWKDSNLDMTNLKSDLHEQDEEHVADDGADEEDDEQEIAPPGPRNMRTIEIERFLPAGQIDARYFEKPYYIVPREEIEQESFSLNSVHCPRSASATTPHECLPRITGES